MNIASLYQISIATIIEYIKNPINTYFFIKIKIENYISKKSFFEYNK